MTFAASLSQLLLAVVFAVAGIAKLADRTSTRGAIEGFGIPPRAARVGAGLLPVVELAIAAALLTAPTARWGAAAAVVMLAIFSLAIARVLRSGSAPDCNCFGGLTQTEVGRGSLIRNLLLGALATLILVGVGGPVSAVSWVTIPAAEDRVGIALLIACVVLLGLFCWRLLQQNGRLLLRLDAEGSGSGEAARLSALAPLEIGEPAPGFAAHDLAGEPISMDSLLAPGLPVALFFTDPGCGACEAALGPVSRAQRERAGEMTFAVISSGSIARIEQKATEFALDRVVPQDDNRLFDAYRVFGVPGIVEVDARGRLSKAAELGVAAVNEVVLNGPSKPEGERLALNPG